MSKDGRLWLSHTGLDLMTRCPRCFWMQYKKGIRQPEGISSRLPNRFDRILKNYFNLYRNSGELPELVCGKLKGRLQNPFRETYFYQIDADYGFFGKLDECIVSDSGEYIPVDFKTASSDPREGEILEAYKDQIDDYLFLLETNHLHTPGYGYLIFFFPDLGERLHEIFPIIMEIKKVDGDPHNTTLRLEKALTILNSPIPDSNPDCAFCKWHTQVNDLISRQ